MADSLLTPGEQDSLAVNFNSIHATFARPIVIFKTAQEIVISTNPAHNFLFDNAPTNDIVQNVIQSGVFNARVLYARRENLGLFDALGGQGTQNNIKKEEGEVRIKLDPTGAQYLFDAQRVTLDGTIFENLTSARPHGLFVPNFYTFYLKKLN